MAIPDSNQHYRADIDGLRAIAVLAVLASHAGIPYMAGGYVGVDVFFVISGYLISGLILADLDQGRFSFHAFYFRRARRILPPLVLVVAVSLIAGYLLLLPHDLRELGRSAVAALLFFPNFHFSQVVGYFDTARSFKPLLMTWSLGVEEQFYLVFPLLLFAIWKFGARGRLGWILGVGAAASFVACVMGAGVHPDVAYFMPHVRAFELLAGALLALWRTAANVPRWVQHGASVAGLGLIGFSVVTLSEESAFPGLNALPPVLGTVLLIGAGRGAAVNRVLLSARPMVFVGTISYSLYLWHWPLLSFAYHLRPARELPLTLTLPLMTVAFSLATASTHLLELPLRRRLVSTSRWRLVPYAAATLVVAAAGHQYVTGRGLPWRLPEEAHAKLRSHSNLRVPIGADCEPKPPKGHAPSVHSHCPDDRHPRNTLMVWGDSHARAIAVPFSEWAQRSGWAYILMSSPACRPSIDWQQFNLIRQTPYVACSRHNERAAAFALSHAEVKIVVLAARWNSIVPAESSVASGPKDYLVHLSNPNSGRPPFHQHRQAFIDSTEALARRLSAAGKVVILVSQVPTLPYHAPRCAANSYTLPLRQWAAVACDADASADANRMRFFHDTFTRFAREIPNTCLIEPAKFLCDGKKCRAADGDELFYWDHHHLTIAGAKKVFEHAQPIACLEKFRKAP